VRHKPAVTDREQSSTAQQPRILFTGWCIYGYWLNGELLNRTQYKDRFGPIRAVKSKEAPKQKYEERLKEERKSWRRNTPKTAYQPATQEFSAWLAQIPTLDDWKAGQA
jgi:hypothetical protein